MAAVVLGSPSHSMSMPCVAARASLAVVLAMEMLSTAATTLPTAMADTEGVGEGLEEGVAPGVREPEVVVLGVGELEEEGRLDMEEEG